MILGIGTDLVRIDRIARLRGRPRALERLFTRAEIDYCLSLARPDPSLAARFAAKEAYFKAAGTGWGRGGRWTEVEVVREPGGRPMLRLEGRARQVAQDAGVRHVHLSLSHTADTAAAFVVLEG